MQSNTELAKRITNSDEIAFSCLYNKLWVKLYVFAQSIIMDEAEAKDILQEVWLDYWNRRKKTDVNNIEGYLHQAIRYKTYNILRDKKFNNVQLEVSNELPTDAVVELNHDLDATNFRLNHCIEKLPPRSRKIFILSRYDGLNNEEIATKIGISKRTVENQLSIALKLIKNNMEHISTFILIILNFLK